MKWGSKSTLNFYLQLAHPVIREYDSGPKRILPWPKLKRTLCLQDNSAVGIYRELKSDINFKVPEEIKNKLEVQFRIEVNW